jgi:hypothetical protein
MLFDLSGLRRLGIDEISLRKGQEDYIVVLVDLDKKELIGMVSSRKHKDIKAELKSWGEEVLGQIKEVSIDMSGSYRGLIKKVGSIGFCMQMFTENMLVPYSRAESLEKSLSLANQHSES